MLYLHCGWPRTGTSTLQAALFANRDRLKAIGVVYPERWLSPFGPTHHGLSGLLRASLESREPVDDLRRFLAAQADGSVLFSAEILTYWTFSDEKQDALLRFLTELTQVTAIRCIWTLRRLDRVINSLELQQLKRREPTRDAASKPSESTHQLDKDEVARWNRLFAGMREVERILDGEATYVNYHSSGRHHAELLDAFGIGGDVAHEVGEELAASRLNASPSRKQAMALSELDTLSVRTGVDLDRALLVEGFERGAIWFEGDRSSEAVGPEMSGRIHREALDAARRHGVQSYVDFFESDEIVVAPSGGDPSAITDADLARLVALQARASEHAVTRAHSSPVQGGGQ